MFYNRFRTFCAVIFPTDIIYLGTEKFKIVTKLPFISIKNQFLIAYNLYYSLRSIYFYWLGFSL